MKQRIIISGELVHDVGYRLNILQYAQKFRIKYLEAFNGLNEENEEVIIYLDIDESKSGDFIRYLHKHKPESAIITAITAESYEGEIDHISSFSMNIQTEQMVKAVPLLQKISKMQEKSISLQEKTIVIQEETMSLQRETISLQKETISLQHQTIGELEKIHTDFMEEIKVRMARMEDTLDKMKVALEHAGILI